MVSDKPVPLWERLTTRLRFWIADIAIRFCGLPTLYWAAPGEWEEYMSVGEPYTDSEQEDSESE